MPSKPFLEVIDREYSKAAGAPATEIASSLLVELVNHGSAAYRRCIDDADSTTNVHLAPFFLYRQILENIDGLEVLLAEACAPAAQPLLRAALEAEWQLKFILDSEQQTFHKRSLAFLCAHYRQKLNELEQFDRDTQQGHEFHDLWDKEFQGLVPLGDIEDMLKKGRAFYETNLEGAQFEPIIKELDTLPKNSPWYRAFGGPPNVRELALRVKARSVYDIQYRKLSQAVHGHNLDQYILSLKSGEASMRILRDHRDLPRLALHAAFTMLGGTRILVEFYRPGESLNRWYAEDVKPQINRLKSLVGKTGITYKKKREI